MITCDNWDWLVNNGHISDKLATYLVDELDTGDYESDKQSVSYRACMKLDIALRRFLKDCGVISAV